MDKLLRAFTVSILLVALGASGAPAADDLARQVLNEMNLARTAPARYAQYIKELGTHFHGKVLRLPNSAHMIWTQEGKSAVDDAVRALAKQKPVRPLAWSDGLADAAGDLLKEQERSGSVGHTGKTSGGMRERIERHGSWSGRISENIGYGPITTGRLMVMQLIVDDGVRDRGHRKNIFDPDVRVAGVACGPHPEYGTMCVTDFAAEFK